MRDAPVRTTDAGREMQPAEVSVWDPFVRLFHWTIVALFIMAWITADDLESLHSAGGYAIAGLLALRLVWGVVGTRHARFANFVRGPGTVLRYLADTVRLRAKRYIGHNPAGAAMIVALLLALAATATTGIAMDQTWFRSDDWLEDLHEALANLTLALAAVHVAGVIAASLLHRENLIRAMFTGKKRRKG